MHHSSSDPGHPSPSLPASPNPGTRIQLTITDLAFGGDGVGRLDGLVVFVPWVVPGEVVEVALHDIRKQFARGTLLRLIQPSPDRVEARCRYFGECGGCQYQHLDYGAQVRWKQKQIQDLMARIGGLDPECVQPVIPCPRPYGYRNRVLVRSQWNKPAQCLNLGFIRGDCGLVVDVERCEIAEPALNAALAEWRRHPPPKGGLKTVLRMPPEGWEVPEHSFFQNNFHLLSCLVGTVRGCLTDSKARFLVDAYCGVGFFSIELATSVDAFVGVEQDASAIRAARRNAAARGILNGEYLAGDADAELPALMRRFDPAKTAVILDPPRTGCHPPIVALLRDVRPAQILYVSCHPATLARDLKLLCEAGTYQVARIQPLDMFPQTQHVECVADVRLRAGVTGASA